MKLRNIQMVHHLWGRIFSPLFYLFIRLQKSNVDSVGMELTHFPQKRGLNSICPYPCEPSKPNLPKLYVTKKESYMFMTE